MPQLRPITYITVTLSCLAFILGIIGFNQIGNNIHFSSACYRSLQLFTLTYPEPIAYIPTELNIARFLAPLSIAIGLCATALHLSRDLLHTVLLKLANGHVIITGINESVAQLSTDLISQKKRVIIITNDTTNPLLENCRSKGALILTGNSADPQLLRKARINTASDFIAFSEDESSNLDTVLHLINLSRNDTDYPPMERHADCGHLSCHALINDPVLRNTLKSHNMFTKKYSGTNEKNEILDSLTVESFSQYEQTARRILTSNPLEINTNGVLDTNIQLVLLGFGEMAPNFIEQALKTAIYDESTPLPLHIITADPNTVEKTLYSLNLHKKHPSFSVHIHEVSYPSCENFLEALKNKEISTDRNTSYACIHNDHRTNLETGFALYKQTNKAKILVAMNKALSDTSPLETHSPNCHFFGIRDEPCTYLSVTQRHSETVARILHAKYLKTGHLSQDSFSEKSKWTKLSEVKRAQNIGQIDHLPTKLRLLNLDPTTCKAEDISAKLQDAKTVDLLSRLEHERWNRTHLLSGYTYANEKNDRLKTTPYLVSYDQLEQDIQQYDIDFIYAMPEIFKLSKKLSKKTIDQALPDELM